MPKEQVSSIDGFDSDIIGNQLGEAVRHLNPVLTRLDEAFWQTVIAVDFGGAQYLVERAKINKGIAGDKFPLGLESLNATEEFLEGSIPAVIGAFGGKMLYRLISKNFSDDLSYKQNRMIELRLMTAGAAFGYGVMMELGLLIEEHLGIHDIKWGPFK